ncbi:MAG: hypothetical protein K6C68_05445 [Ruminococcus sp.]|nr:hypothetical protein [Ruminococcus sp.]
MREYDFFNFLIAGFFGLICMPTIVGTGVFIVNIIRHLHCNNTAAKKAAIFGLILAAVTFPMFYMGARCLIDFFFN